MRLLGAVVLGIIAVGAFWPVPVAVLEAGPDHVLWRQEVPRPLHLRLEYTHSVERTPVVEVYRLGPDGLRLVRMEFVSQGAGLPSEGYVREGGRFVLRTDRPLSALSLRVSAVAAPRLVFGNQAVDLVRAAGDGREVTLRVRRAPRLFAGWGMLYF